MLVVTFLLFSRHASYVVVVTCVHVWRAYLWRARCDELCRGDRLGRTRRTLTGADMNSRINWYMRTLHSTILITIIKSNSYKRPSYTFFAFHYATKIPLSPFHTQHLCALRRARPTAIAVPLVLLYYLELAQFVCSDCCKFSLSGGSRDDS